MTARFGIPVVVAAFAVSALAPAAISAQGSPAEIEAVIARFLVPFSNRDVGSFIDFFADDATLFMPPSVPGATAQRVQGRAAIGREFEGFYGRTPPPAGAKLPLIAPQELHVQRFGDSAVVTFHLGDDARRGRRTFVLRQFGAEWKIVHLHASTFNAQ